MKVKRKLLKEYFLFLFFLSIFVLQIFLLAFSILDQRFVLINRAEEKSPQYSFDLKFLTPTPTPIPSPTPIESKEEGFPENNNPSQNQPTSEEGNEIDNSQLPIEEVQGRFYYYQCSNVLSKTKMPGTGCTYCKAGCGPTTVAMIVSTYVRHISPIEVGNLYRQRGFYIGCDGTNISSAKMILESFGFQTSDYIFSRDAGFTKQQVLDDMKAFTDRGYEIFALADFYNPTKKAWHGHFFWIVRIDPDGKIWTYDPYYGNEMIPLDLHRFYNVKYRSAFAFKFRK